MTNQHFGSPRSTILCPLALLAFGACASPSPVSEDSAALVDGTTDGPTRDAAANDASIDAATEPADAAADAGASSDTAASSDAPQTDGGAVSDGSAGDAAPVRLLDRYALSARFPEGGAYDPSQRAFYVGSLGDGTVHRVAAETGAERVVFTESAAGRWWTLGMDLDVARNRLWVCAMDDRSPSPRQGYVWVFDTLTHRRIATVALSAAAMDPTCTDVAVTADGRGYVCDREQGRIYRVEVGAAPTVFARSAALSASLVGQNGIVVLPDQSALLAILYGPPSLARVDLRDASVRTVTINGRFSDLTPLAGADGIAFANGSAYVAFTSKLIRVTPTLADWSRADSTNVDLPNGMTDVIATPAGLYLLNGQSVRFALGTATDPFALVRFTGAL
jgi:sugar lactone lactonase YvrE